MSDYSPIQPIAYVMDDKYLPIEVRPLAQTWRKADERADDVELKLSEIRGAKNEAKNADTQAATEAVKAGKPVPVPHDQHERDNEAATRSAEIELQLVLRHKVTAGDALLKVMLEHRDEIGQLAVERVTKAMEPFAAAMNAAEATITNARAALGEATEGLGTYFDLNVDPRHLSEVGAAQNDIAGPDFSKARLALDLLQIDLAQITKPSPRMTVRTLDGKYIEFPNALGMQTIRDLGATFVAPEDAPADALQVGLRDDTHY